MIDVTVNGKRVRIISAKVPKGADWSQKMEDSIKAQLGPGEVWGGKSQTTHAEITGAQFAKSEYGATSGKVGTTPSTCPSCQDWFSDNAPGYSIDDPR